MLCGSSKLAAGDIAAMVARWGYPITMVNESLAAPFIDAEFRREDEEYLWS